MIQLMLLYCKVGLCVRTYMSCSLLFTEPGVRVWNVGEGVDDLLVHTMAFNLSFQTRAVAVPFMIDCGSHLDMC